MHRAWARVAGGGKLVLADRRGRMGLAAAAAVTTATLAAALLVGGGHARPTTTLTAGQAGPATTSGPPGSTPGNGAGVTTSTAAPTTTSTTVGASPTSTVAAPPTSTRSAPPPPPKTFPTVPGRTFTGRVVGPDGSPVADAYLIGLHSLAVTRTDANGNFSMACPDEPLAAAGWLIPLDRPGGGGFAYGRDTTDYPQPLPAESASYTFTGGSSVDTATPPACSGAPTVLTLPAPATVRIIFAGSDDSSGGEADDQTNLYLPALDGQAALEVAAIDNGVQTVSGLAPGTLRVDMSGNCTGPGVTDDPDVLGVQVQVAAGQTVDVTCGEPDSPPSGPSGPSVTVPQPPVIPTFGG